MSPTYAALEVLPLSAGRDALESRIPNLSPGDGAAMDPGFSPVNENVRLTVSVSPTPRVTGDPGLVKKAEIMSALVVFQVNRAEPGATVTAVLLWALSQVVEPGGANVERSPSEKLSLISTNPFGEVTPNVAMALWAVPAELLTVTE